MNTYICTMNDSPLHIRLKQERFESPVHQAMLSILVSADIIKRNQLAVCFDKELTHSQYNILRILKGTPEGFCRKEIIERMLEKAPDVTRLIDGLVARNLAERIQSPIDKRMSLTRITEEGLHLLDELHVPMQSFAKEMDAMFSEEELLTITELCGRVIAHELQIEGMLK
ncbi:MAG: MarR family winged helix-turn-helix transcriptional regulator [Ignavibacteria bacterium]